MLKEIYFYLWLSKLLTLAAGGWFRTFPVTEEFADNGHTGTCTYTSNGKFECPFELVNNASFSSELMTLTNNRLCKYYRKISVDVCYNERKGAGLQNKHQEFSCVRNKVYYYMTQNCFNNWLSWETCGKPCGGGKTKRYRFLSYKTYTTQSKSCNTNSCPYWSSWTKAGNACNGNCTQKYNRNCTADGVIVEPEKCAAIDTGNGLDLSVEYRPCPHECQKVKQSQRKEIYVLPGTHIATTFTQTQTTTQSVYGLLTNASTNKSSQSKSVNVSGSSDSQETLSLWMGICIGIVVVVCAIVLFALFRCYKTNWSNISISNVRFHKSSRNDSTITGTTMVAARSRRNTSSSSFERWFRRSSGNDVLPSPTHVTDPTMSQNPNSQLYLMPNVTSTTVPTTSNQHFSNQQNSPQENVPLQAPTIAASVSQYQSHVLQPTSQFTGENNPSSEPIYADIPGHQQQISSQIDDFTSDSDFDSIDDLDEQNYEQQPSVQTRPLPEPAVFQPKVLQSHKIQRSATERAGHRLYADPSTSRFPKHRKHSLGYQRDPPIQEQNYSHINQMHKPLDRLQEHSTGLSNQQGSSYNDLQPHGFSRHHKRYSLRQPGSFQNSTYLDGRTFREPPIPEQMPKRHLPFIPADESDYNLPVDRIHTPEDDYDTYNLPYQSNG